MKPVVAQLIDSFNQGGSERQALQLTRLLSEGQRFKVHLASLSPEGSLRASVADLDLGNIPSFPLNSFYDHNAVRQLRSCVRWLKELKVDVLHTHDFYTNVFGMTAGMLARTPVRIASMRETEGMRTRGQHKVQRFAYSLAHHVVVNSDAVREKIVADGTSGAKIIVVYNGLDLRRVQTGEPRAEVLSSLKLPSENGRCAHRYVTIVANMRHDVKDYPMFLRAAKRVKQAVPAATFLLAGEGELMASLRALSNELGIGDSTVFLGRCDAVAELLSISDVCVLSSKAEGFSNSILEYMAAGRPVVATDVGGAREAIVEGETGHLVPSGDDDAMAARIAGLLQDPERANKMGERGRQVVLARFSSEVQRQQVADLYNRLLNRKVNGH